MSTGCDFVERYLDILDLEHTKTHSHTQGDTDMDTVAYSGPVLGSGLFPRVTLFLVKKN